MKKITKIEIENYRAFYGNYTIKLPKGENLLIYGENGSGKSSFFKALNNYLSSSRDATFPFTRNNYSSAPNGEIKLTFQDFDDATFQPVAGTEQDLAFGSAVSTNAIQFVKDAELIKGFLDYRNLLDVYFHKEPNPNLFELIVLKILGKQFNVAKTFRFAEKWTQLQKNLKDNSYTRNDRTHQYALNELPVYQSAIETILKDVFKVLNTELLKKYFPELNIELRFELKPIVFNYSFWKSDWWTTADLRLKVFQNGVPVPDNYNDFLNEARLSAFALCIYLAALKRNPETIEYKILFLDDVFVGLDTSNRIPILKILQQEFIQRQIIIATYDRHLYELANRQFETETPGKWQKVEFYVGNNKVGTQNFEQPIIVKGESNYEKGTHYLHDRQKPDYPAAANYFRKALEELIKEFIPKWETADAENTQLPDFQLTQLIIRTKRFLGNSGNSTEYIDNIKSLLSSLLHPLSHHEITAPIYKGELIIIESNFIKLKKQLQDLDISNNFKCCLEQGKRLKMTFEVNATTNHFSYYELILKDPLTLQRNGAAIPFISKVHCIADRCFGNNGTTDYPSFNPDKKNPDFNYESLSNAYDRIHTYLIGTPIGAFPKVVDYVTTIQFHDGTDWQPLSNLIVW
jgi:energy-coupling factor transporter ATP-binding protein EcfA2